VADVGVHIMRVYDSIDLAGRSLPAPHSDARNRGGTANHGRSDYSAP
jgi:hypothetical protein